jgi:branched-chain amino acid transport system substrate-binding protein
LPVRSRRHQPLHPGVPRRQRRSHSTPASARKTFAALSSLAALLAALALVACGCGGVGVSGASDLGNLLTVYSSLPLQGASAGVSQQIVNGEKLALYEAGGHVGPYRVSYYSLDDANPQTGQWDPGITAADAKTAAQDTSTIAYLGDYNSPATAISLPLINAAGILQIAPASPYVGLTSSLDAGQDEPERFYPTGRRSFGRLQPADPIQAAAQVKLMGALGVKRLYVIDDQDPFQIPLAQILGADATSAGIQVLAHDSIATTAGSEFSGEVHKVAGSGAQAVFFSGGTSAGVVSLWQQLHAADPHLLLLGPNTMLNASFATRIGSAGASTYITTPILPAAAYPASAQRLFADYRVRFHEPATPEALYGYEAMSVVLDAIRRAGSHGNDKQAVIDQFFHTRDRDSVLGRYSIQPSGDTTLTRYAAERIAGGQLVFWREIAG